MSSKSSEQLSKLKMNQTWWSTKERKRLNSCIFSQNSRQSIWNKSRPKTSLTKTKKHAQKIQSRPEKRRKSLKPRISWFPKFQKRLRSNLTKLTQPKTWCSHSNSWQNTKKIQSLYRKTLRRSKSRVKLCLRTKISRNIGHPINLQKLIQSSLKKRDTDKSLRKEKRGGLSSFKKNKKKRMKKSEKPRGRNLIWWKFRNNNLNKMKMVDL